MAGTMHLDPHDLRPRSLFDRQGADGRAVSAGLVTAGIVHVALPVTVFVITAVASAVGIDLLATPERPPPVIENVVQARFVQLGEVLDPHQLPNRQVPILRTDTPEPQHAPSLRDDPTPPPPRPERERQAHAVDDLLQRLSNDAQQFAEREEARVREGDPEGVEGGTERNGNEGDLYRGRLWAFFRRGWSVPTTIADEVVQGLTAVVVIDIADDTRITGYRIARSSNNPDFDQSVDAQMTRIIASSPNIPAPPEEVADQYLGRQATLNFRGRDAQR